MKQLNDQRGVFNVLSLLLALFLIKEYYALFDMKNVRNFHALLYGCHILHVVLLVFTLLLRSIYIYFSRQIFVLVLSEAIIYYLIYTKTQGTCSFGLGLFTMINLTKLYSFIVDAPGNTTVLNSEKRKVEKRARKIENSKRKKELRAEEKDRISLSLNFISFLRFLCLPTLCVSDAGIYRYRKSRIGDLLFNLLMTIVLFFSFNLFISFYLFPLLQAYTLTNFLTDVTAFVQIGITVFIAWILFFFLFFKYYLSFLAECTNYHNVPYGPWWNAENFGDFWRNWNLPTHLWLRTYIFRKCSSIFKSKMLSSFCVFLISGIFHEILFVLTYKKVSGLLFLGILSQFFFIYLQNMFFISGNLIFWCLFCFIGQPVLILLQKKEILEVVFINS